MERLTGKQAQSMMEAFASVYEEKVEPTETEQVEEGVVETLKKAVKTVIGPANQSPEAEAARTNKRRPQTKQEKGVAAGTVNNEDVEVDRNTVEEGMGRLLSGALLRKAAEAAKKSKTEKPPTKEDAKEDADLFDIIKGHLIDEGLSEEEALKKMLTLTDDERSEIIEGSCDSKNKKKMKKGGY